MFIVSLQINNLSVFSIEGLVKGRPPTDDQIRKHKEQWRQLEHWRVDVSALEMILSKLKKEYEQHKEDFALGRYEELKEMIKSAVTRFHEVVKENSNHRYDSGASSQAGHASSLRKNAESFAKQQEALSGEEKRYSGNTVLQNDDVKLSTLIL